MNESAACGSRFFHDHVPARRLAAIALKIICVWMEPIRSCRVVVILGDQQASIVNRIRDTGWRGMKHRLGFDRI
jgi:hypothetical protein